MRIKPTFFNTRNKSLHWDYTDTNNRLLTIILDNGQELNFIFRDLKKTKLKANQIIYKRFGKDRVKYIECDRISKTEYDMLKNLGTPSINNVNIR
tara:strand:- start:657 stop:941 length:285 start_codon:yes stop_codon:yes gene_type:complete